MCDVKLPDIVFKAKVRRKNLEFNQNLTHIESSFSVINTLRL